MKRLLLVSMGLVVGLVGCSPPPILVDADLARQTLTTVLDGWKAGKKIGDWRNSSPEIVVQDFDWLQQAKLVEYQFADEGKSEDANLRIQVRMKLRDSKGNVIEKTVIYVVGTAPALTVFRAME